MPNGTKFLKSELKSFPGSISPAAIWVVRKTGKGEKTVLNQLLAEVIGGAGDQQLPMPPMNRLLISCGREKTVPLVEKSGSRVTWVRSIGKTGAVALQYLNDSKWCKAVEHWALKFTDKIDLIFDELSKDVHNNIIETYRSNHQSELFDSTPFSSTGKSRIPVYLPRYAALPVPEFIDSSAGIVGVSKELEEVCNAIIDVAPSDANVLINGETGTGKELFAKLLHMHSNRKGKPMVGINCASLPDNLFESELFGHKSGSFTGASVDKKGLLESANLGTFFFDEIGDMPKKLQIKLLRVIQEKKLRRIGELRDRIINIRFVSASHKNLQSEVDHNDFRLDLYYRLKVVKVEIPPLRHRPEDIVHLMSHFFRVNRGLNHNIEVDENTLYALQEYSWPGNVRELENEVRRWCALNRDRSCMKIGHLSPEIQKVAGRDVEPHDLVTIRPLSEATEMLERYLIRKAIISSSGCKTAAAKQLGMSRQGLYKKIQRFEMSDLLHTN